MLLFTNRDLKRMILPLFIEQFLIMLVGIIDIFVVSYVGEAAVSGVSLVNALNTIFIYLFTALASGGAVIISQYIGRKEQDSAGETASQLLMASILFSIMMSIIIYLIHQQLLTFLFGKVEPKVMEACSIYLQISVYSYPALAIYNAGAALYRSFGRTSTTMYISVFSNIINFIGSIAGVFVLHAGVASVAYASLAARVFSAIMITVLCFSRKNTVRYKKKWILAWNRDLLERIMTIAIPNGLEDGVFQFVKVALSSIVTLFGTYQIAANGIAQSIWGAAALVGVTMGPIFITVIGQCMGSGNIQAAEHYFKRLLMVTVIFSVAWNALIIIGTPFLLELYAIAPETKHLVILLVLIHNIFNSFVFPFSGPLSSGIRATGDVRFTMMVSIVSTICVRVIFSFILGIICNLGVLGIAYAMCMDWIIRALVFYTRVKNGKWKHFQMI